MPVLDRAERAEVRRLRALVERPERCRFWGQPYVITPRLIAHRFGDGRKLVCITPLATRPNYFVARVDSSVTSVQVEGEYDWGRTYLIDAIMDAQEDEYGHYHTEQQETGKDPDWPIVDWGIGCAWGEPFPVEEWKPSKPPPNVLTPRQRTRRRWAKQGRR